MMGRPRKLQFKTGNRFGRLLVVREVAGTSYSRRILCQCDCGTQKVINLNALVSGNTKSCGCLKRETTAAKSTTHGLSKQPIYRVWSSMKGRCFSETDHSYQNYGAKGIRVCDEWLEFEPFYDWAITNGYERGLTIERIDFDGDYRPDNCTWIPFSEQSKNRRSNHWIEFNGETKTMTQWAKDLGFKRETIKDRIRRGWTVEKALTTPTLINRKKEAI